MEGTLPGIECHIELLLVVVEFADQMRRAAMRFDRATAAAGWGMGTVMMLLQREVG
jgi:hypothetical protein